MDITRLYPQYHNSDEIIFNLTIVFLILISICELLMNQSITFQTIRENKKTVILSVNNKPGRILISKQRYLLYDK